MGGCSGSGREISRKPPLMSSSHLFTHLFGWLFTCVICTKRDIVLFLVNGSCWNQKSIYSMNEQMHKSMRTWVRGCNKLCGLGLCVNFLGSHTLHLWPEGMGKADGIKRVGSGIGYLWEGTWWGVREYVIQRQGRCVLRTEWSGKTSYRRYGTPHCRVRTE